MNREKEKEDEKMNYIALCKRERERERRKDYSEFSLTHTLNAQSAEYQLSHLNR